jgi:phage gpG-like protein
VKPAVRASHTERDRGLKRLAELAREVGSTKPYAKAGILGSQASFRRQTAKESVETAKVARDAKGRILKGSGKKTRKGTQGSGLSNVELAIIMEFGSGPIPARPFIGGTFEKQRPKYEALAAKMAEALYEGRKGWTVERALGTLGLVMATDMKLGITQGSGIPPPNAPSTLARKANKAKRPRGLIGPMPSPRPLVDSGQLSGSITYAVVKAEAVVGEGAAP